MNKKLKSWLIIACTCTVWVVLYVFCEDFFLDSSYFYILLVAAVCFAMGKAISTEQEYNKENRIEKKPYSFSFVVHRRMQPRTAYFLGVIFLFGAVVLFVLDLLGYDVSMRDYQQAMAQYKSF